MGTDPDQIRLARSSEAESVPGGTARLWMKSGVLRNETRQRWVALGKPPFYRFCPGNWTAR